MSGGARLETKVGWRLGGQHENDIGASPFRPAKGTLR